MVYWIPWPQKHKNRHQDHRNRMSFSRFIVKNVFWWRPSLTSNFRREPLECRRVSRDFWNLHTQNPPRAKFHASFRKCTPNSHIRPTSTFKIHFIGWSYDSVKIYVEVCWKAEFFFPGEAPYSDQLQQATSPVQKGAAKAVKVISANPHIANLFSVRT